MLDKIEIYVTIIAAIIIGVISLLGYVNFADMLIRFIVVITVSYSLTVLFKHYIKRFVIIEEENENVDLSQEGSNAEDDSNPDDTHDTDDLSIESEKNTKNTDGTYADLDKSN